MQKKAQISYFIIIGVLLLTIILILQFREDSSIGGPFQRDEVALFVESTLQATAQEGIVFIAGQSGFYEMQEPILYHGRNDKAAYYFFNGKETIPTKEILEQSLEQYVENHFAANLNNFYDLQGYNVNVVERVPNSTVIIRESDVLIQLHYLLEITHSNKKTIYDAFEVKVPINLNKYIQTAKEFVQESNLKQNEVCITCLDTLARRYDLQIDMYDIGDPNILFTLSDNKTMLDGNPLTFSFSIQLSQGNDAINEEFSILPIADQETYIGYPFSYQIKASKETNFFDNSPLFEIDRENGLILFVPLQEDQGSHLIRIDGIDREGHKVSQLFSLNIKGFADTIQIEPITQLIAESGKPFFYRIAIVKPNNSLIYRDNATFFDVSQTGEIAFTPTQAQRGSYDIMITVFDKKGSKSNEELNFVIT